MWRMDLSAMTRSQGLKYKFNFVLLVMGLLPSASLRGVCWVPSHTVPGRSMARSLHVCDGASGCRGAAPSLLSLRAAVQKHSSEAKEGMKDRPQRRLRDEGQLVAGGINGPEVAWTEYLQTELVTKALAPLRLADVLSGTQATGGGPSLCEPRVQNARLAAIAGDMRWEAVLAAELDVELKLRVWKSWARASRHGLVS